MPSQPESFKTKSGRKRSLKLNDEQRQCLDRIRERTKMTRSEALRTLSARLPPAMKGGTWTRAMREGLQIWDKTGRLPPWLRDSKKGPRIRVRDVLLTWGPMEGYEGSIWMFMIRLTVDPNGERISIVGDDCSVSIDGSEHSLGILLRNIHINDGPAQDRVDLGVEADLYLIGCNSGAESWAEPMPTTLRATVDIGAAMGQWARRLPVDLVWAPADGYPVRWVG